MNEITLEMILANKERWNGHKIIYVRFSNSEFLFRTLTRNEYKYIMQIAQNQYDIEDMSCNVACLYPEDYDFSRCPYAGLPKRVFEIIQKTSGFSDIKDIINDFNKAKENTSLEQQCMDLIKAFIPEYTYEEMEDWTWQKLMEVTARAEVVCKLRGFTWEITDHSDEYIEEINNTIRMDNEEFLKTLQDKGIDPMFYFKDYLPPVQHEILDFPLIGGYHWNNEEILNAIRTQSKK